MTVHNKTLTEPEKWLTVKLKVQGKYGTVSAYAGKIGKHTNSIRLAVSGQCPDVVKLMKQEGFLS